MTKQASELAGLTNEDTDAPESDALERLRIAVARKSEIEADAAEVEWRRMEASKDEARIYTFTGPITLDSTQYCIDHLGQWHREDPARPIQIVFNSPGGGVMDGLALYDYIHEIRSQGTRVDTVVLGFAASMAAVLLQAGEERIVGRHAYTMIHEVSSQAIGSMSELEDATKFTKQLQGRLLDILADRSTLSRDEIETKWARRDWWISSEEAVELGFADTIR